MKFAINFILFILFKKQSSNAFISDRLCGEVNPKNTKNVLLVLLDLHQSFNSKTGYCETLIATPLADILQMYHTIDKINQNLNISVGVRICDVCHNDYVAQIIVTENILYLNQTLNIRIIGINQ